MKEKLSTGKKRLLEYLGAPYTTQSIDYENCVYLDLGDHDIEISMGNTIRSSFSIYVWQRKPHLEIMERYFDVKPDLASIKELLDDIRSRYTQKTLEEKYENNN